MSDAGPPVAFVEIGWRDRTVRIEYQWIAGDRRDRPLIVFLHEGLGSLAMWRDFPARLCNALGARGLVWSRPGYGRSTPRRPNEIWGIDFLHRQAFEVLPALLEALGVDTAPDKPWLLGHSDGGSIALLYAARHHHSVAGLVVLAPHTHVEEVSLVSIDRACAAYLSGGLRQRLAKHHDDPDSAFWGWAGAWRQPAFKAWSIEDEMVTISCPLLAVQGLGDEYGTLEQVRGIARRLPQARLLELPGCGHAPHQDRPDDVIRAVAQLFGESHSLDG